MSLSALGLVCSLFLACRRAFRSKPPLLLSVVLDDEGAWDGFRGVGFVLSESNPGGGYGGGTGGADGGGGGGGGGGGATGGGGGGGGGATDCEGTSSLPTRGGDASAFLLVRWGEVLPLLVVFVLALVAALVGGVLPEVDLALRVDLGPEDRLPVEVSPDDEFEGLPERALALFVLYC